MKETQTTGILVRLHQIASKYRTESDKEMQTSAFDDAVVLANVLAQRMTDVLRKSLALAASLPNSDAVRALRLQLSIALTISLDFIGRMARVWHNQLFNHVLLIVIANLICTYILWLVILYCILHAP